jgi:anaerobic selenocysteine-containing dehydrogenase
MAINRHHVSYDPEWIPEITGIQHKTLMSIQRMNATPENYAKLTNFMHAVAYEWNRIRQELDGG